ncbi:LOB domain-containing protein 1-like isoform X2 [Vitis riparia]|uniref:LOB domain-containing protein 1-like isoform X2 n=1 Tax=Vitis riparia TaxID=96939 RepID=UPI00155A7DFD|nr:LOB domain-containing protein 1-like isoform X2 [Vitis riparia]
MMENTNKTRRSLRVSTPFSFSSSSYSPSLTPSPSLPTVAQGPCAACKVLRRRCTDTCFLAPYFPPSEQLKFVIAHKVFGASNIVKALQELPESKRADAVSSMVYEANVRIHDPVYGCAGAISKLQKQLNDLQAELAVTQAELLIMQCQQQQQNDIASFFDRDLGSDWQPHCA